MATWAVRQGAARLGTARLGVGQKGAYWEWRELEGARASHANVGGVVDGQGQRDRVADALQQLGRCHDGLGDQAHLNTASPAFGAPP